MLDLYFTNIKNQPLELERLVKDLFYIILTEISDTEEIEKNIIELNL